MPEPSTNPSATAESVSEPTEIGAVQPRLSLARVVIALYIAGLVAALIAAAGPEAGNQHPAHQEITQQTTAD